MDSRTGRSHDTEEKAQQTLCFTMPQSLAHKVRHNADAKGLSVPELIMDALRKEVERPIAPTSRLTRVVDGLGANLSRERRLFPRHELNRPGVAQLLQTPVRRYLQCTVQDISLGGAQVRFPRNTWDSMRDDDILKALRHDDAFELLLNLPDTNRSLCLSCRVVRLEERHGGADVGAICDRTQMECRDPALSARSV